MTYSKVRCTSALSKSSLPGLDYTVNPYIGCEHGCIYCYVPDVLKRQEFADSWGEKVYAKENVHEALAGQVRRLRSGVVGLSTVTDAYQPYERKLCLVRRVIETLLANGFKISFQTKSGLILRDQDLIKGDNVEVGFTITSLDKDFAKQFEPKAPPPEVRVQALETFFERRVKTYIFYGPIIPNYNDDDKTINDVLNIAKRTHSRVLYDVLRLKPILSKRLQEKIGVEGYAEIRESLYRGCAESVYSKILRASRQVGVGVEPAFP
jgi:DNA repair photolyase